MAEVKVILPRYELKQVYSNLMLPELRSWIIVHPAGFRQAYPPRQVNSIYLDTQDLDTFNDHIEGVPIRRKLRYRWYGANTSIGQFGQIEVKNKSELSGWKLIEKLNTVFDFQLSGWTRLQNQMRDSASGVFKELLAVSRPVLLTVYDREYFVSANGLIRLTIDFNLMAYDQYLKPSPNLKFPYVSNEQLILELKSDTKQIRELTEVLSHFPIRSSRYSKFVTNMWQLF